MQNADNFDGHGIGTVDDQVGIYRPESQRLGREVGAQMSNLRTLGQHTACGSNLGEDLRAAARLSFAMKSRISIRSWRAGAEI
jgi:hypothetical protein